MFFSLPHAVCANYSIQFFMPAAGTTKKRRRSSHEAVGEADSNGSNVKEAQQQLSAPGVWEIPREAACAICQEPWRDCVALVPCGHLFCTECVTTWLKCASSCPTCRATVPSAKPRWLRVRAVDDLIQALRQRGECVNSNSICESKDTWNTDDSSAPEPLPSTTCYECHAPDAYEICGPCGSLLELCRVCAPLHASQCEECEQWFCGAWCAAKACTYCHKSHVCYDCKGSPLRRCPRPEC
mmetsp:Transcript_85355/g.147552  ORF Transcript_85355/g.147552 Transcript_85355/m.147552 type:complete len:240 (-) Transcript_85355:232-951(-)